MVDKVFGVDVNLICELRMQETAWMDHSSRSTNNPLCEEYIPAPVGYLLSNGVRVVLTDALDHGVSVLRRHEDEIVSVPMELAGGTW